MIRRISHVLFEATVKVEATADIPYYRKCLDQRPLAEHNKEFLIFQFTKLCFKHFLGWAFFALTLEWKTNTENHTVERKCDQTARGWKKISSRQPKLERKFVLDDRNLKKYALDSPTLKENINTGTRTVEIKYALVSPGFQENTFETAQSNVRSTSRLRLFYRAIRASNPRTLFVGLPRA